MHLGNRPPGVEGKEKPRPGPRGQLLRSELAPAEEGTESTPGSLTVRSRLGLGKEGDSRLLALENLPRLRLSL